MVHPWPKGNRPATRVTAPRETDPQQTSCGNQRFFRAMLVITMILRDSIYWDSAWQALPKVFYYIYHAYCVSSTFLNIYTYIIYVYTQKSHNFSFASHVSLSESLCTDTHTHTHTHTQGQVRLLFPHHRWGDEDAVSQILWIESGRPWIHSLVPEPLLLTISWNRLRTTLVSMCILFSVPNIYGRRRWHPLQYSRLENPMDGGAW